MIIKKDSEKFFDLLEKSIISLESFDGETMTEKPFKLCYYKKKYSNIKAPSLNIFYGDTPIDRNKFKVTYKCLCGNISTIHLKKFLAKKTIVCSKCRETEEKRKNHSILLRTKNFKEKIHKKVFEKIEDKINKSIKEFNLESAEFIRNFYDKNLTIAEYNNIKDKIVGVNGISVLDKKIEFVPIMRIGNQTKYSQYILIDGIETPFKNIKFKCDNCGDNFNTSRRPKEKINNKKILCQTCYFCNKIFKIRKYITIFGDELLYQSNLEKKFIEMCEKNNIKIFNGFKIDYFFKNKKRKYRVDFYLPEYKILIEIKDNHVWHRKQLDSGMWGAKQLAAEKYSEINNLKYNILFQEDLDEFFKPIKI